MEPDDRRFEALLDHLKEARGFDFTGYKRSSLMRRFGRRMAQVQVGDYNEYLDYLQVHPGRVHRPVQHDPDQRYGVLPRPRRLGVSAQLGARADDRR